MCKLQSLLSSNHIGLLRSHDDEVDNYDAMVSTKTSIGVDPSSACLWAMVNDFLEMDCTRPEATCEDQITSRAPREFLRNTASSSDATLQRSTQEMESICGESSALQDAWQAKISNCVVKALNSKRITVGAESAHNEQVLWAVLKHLRKAGYDAGLSVTARKPGNGGVGIPPTAGGHRYIDVLLEEKPGLGTPHELTEKRPSEKLIVDVGFPAHFEIARPLPAYEKLIELLPSTFIGTPALLRRVVRIMSQAARASLESQGMSIPPWRSFSFLLAKWLSPCCSRVVISVDKAEHIVNSTSSARMDCIKPRVLAELKYNAGLANHAEVPARHVDESCEKRRPKLSFFAEEDVAKAWYPPPPIAASQIPNSQYTAADDDFTSSSSSYKRRSTQASVVSALALALAETQLSTHNMGTVVATELRKAATVAS